MTHHATGALYGRGWCATSVWRREFAANAALKKWPISLLARQRGISYFYYYAVILSDGVSRLSLNLSILPILLDKMTLFFGPQSGVCLLRFLFEAGKLR
ncbi:hypothetical protein AAG94_06325 [Escherichia albertii]|nr:hypothetical protein [Escherichia albertii]EEW3330062.1 hypothetical protein [Escherichia albertii]EEW4357956.1 hypothetical protein [Escherichia albertii]EEW6710059.1 hypothetical protein [Escherichia albertii]EEW7342978.1 hypothetical protein [Escherichia albertii]